ncbi:DUF3173 family protein [Streptococcus suis]|uniref:DUF3173 family protein n=1 Tax=Streptococcus suis TaxID=1307 RepID=UPI003977AE06
MTTNKDNDTSERSGCQIREAKRIAVKKFEEARKVDHNAVQLSKSPFDNRRLGIAPKDIVEELIGISLSEDNLESEN